jgi:hypothetical protein
MSKVRDLQPVREMANQELVAELEVLVERARAGEFTGAIIFRFGSLPKTVGHTVCGSVLEADCVYALERWIHQHFDDKA